MKIVHFLNSSGHAGDAQVALLVAKQQRIIGHDARIIIEQSRNSALFLARARSEGVPALEASALSYDVDSPTPKRALEFWKVLIKYPNVILHMHTGRPLVRTADVLAARMLPLKARVATVHAPSDWSTYDDPEGRKKTWRRASVGLDLVLCPSSYSRKLQLEAGLPPAKVRVQPNPVDIEQIKKGDRGATRQQLGLSESDLLVLFLARLDDDKNPVDAIHGFSAITSKFPNAILALAGSGNQESACLRAVEELHLTQKVRLLGYRTDTANLLQAADIYLLPTKWENLSMSLLEAMAASLPIITTPVGGNLELVQAEETALFTRVGDTASISGALDRLLGDKDLRHSLGKRAYEAAQRFSLPTIAHQHIALYQSIIPTSPIKPGMQKTDYN
ncbi:glycosyltransferase family 4 protein [Chloroflexales bacterium ZM16-3]|nr:glycosyltransferase family 4 protein [Chloroflexales bacterium ZM16-3]